MAGLGRLRGLVCAAATAAVLAARPVPVHAQATPADTAAVLLRVAVQLEEQGRRELAEGLFAFILERYRGTPSAEEVERRLARLRQTRVDRSGRTELVVWGTMYGLWLGIAAPAAASAEGPTPYGLGLLLGGPVGFLASKRFAESRPMSTGQARAIIFGGQWGWWQAMGWREVAGSVSTEQFFTTTIAGMLGGMAAGAAVAASRPIAGGDASLVQHGGLWGTWFGVATNVIADVGDGETRLAWTLVGGNLGVLAALLATPRSSMSAGRVWLITAAGVAGLVAGFGVDLILQVENAQAGMGIPLATSVLGLIGGASVTRSFDAPSRADAGGSWPANALLTVRRGRLVLGIPSPAPALLPRDDGAGGTRWTPGFRVTLFEAAH